LIFNPETIFDNIILPALLKTQLV